MFSNEPLIITFLAFVPQKQPFCQFLIAKFLAIDLLFVGTNCCERFYNLNLKLDISQLCCLKEELFEEVCCVHDAENQDGGQVDGEDGVHDPSAKDKHHGDTSGGVVLVNIVQSPVLDDVLGEHSLGVHAQPVRHNFHNFGLQLPHNQFHRAYLH